MIFNNRRRQQSKAERQKKLKEFQNELQEEPLERSDYLAMVMGAFIALAPMLLIIVGVLLFLVNAIF